jgi:hypothetical protein
MPKIEIELSDIEVIKRDLHMALCKVDDLQKKLALVDEKHLINTVQWLVYYAFHKTMAEVAKDLGMDYQANDTRVDLVKIDKIEQLEWPRDENVKIEIGQRISNKYRLMFAKLYNQPKG